MQSSPLSRFCLPLMGLALLCAGLVGCGDSNQSPTSASPQAEPLAAPPAVPLTVQVAGDVELAEGVRLLRGEWKARTGGDLKVDSVSLDELLSAERIVGDVVIFPSRLLGTLVERGDLRPLRTAMLSSPEFGLNDIYPAIRNSEMKYGGQVFAFPLGSPPLLNFRQLGAPAATSVAGNGSAPAGSVSPTDGLAAAYALVLRALGHTETYRREEALFDPADMKPRIAEPPFVRALVDLAAANAWRADQPPLGFAEAMQLVVGGDVVSTLGWPSRLDEEFAVAAGARPRNVEFTAVAPPADVYASSRGAWEQETNPASVVLLGCEGRLVAATTATRNAVPAFQLAQWLTTGDLAASLSARSTGTLWYRASQASASGKWMKGLEVAKEGEPVTKVVAAALATDAPILIPRLPAIDEYLAVLADAVRTAPADQAAAQAALEGVAARWEAITDRVGRDRQAAAYRRHLGETE